MIRLDLTNLGRGKPVTFQYCHPHNLSSDATAKWLSNTLEGGIGKVEYFIKNNQSTIQLSSTGSYLPFNERQPFYYRLPSSNAEFFQFYLKKPCFYEIKSESWINTLDDFHGEAWIQISFQKDKGNRLRELFRQYYEDYLRGVDSPSPYKVIREFQLKVAHLSEKLNLFTPPIPSFEERKQQPIYRLIIGGVVQGDKVNRDRLLNTFLHRLNSNRQENEWGIVRIKDTKRAKKWKESVFLSSYNHSLITEQELIHLLPCSAVEKTAHPKLQLQSQVKSKKNILPIFQFLPNGQMEQEPILLDSFQHELNGALEKLGIIKEEGLKISGFEQGPTLMRLNAILPKGIRLSDLQRNISDWQAELGITDLSVMQGKEKGICTLTLPRKNKQIIFLRDLIDTEEFKQFSTEKTLPFVIGASETGEPIFEDLVRIKHLLVAGTTGSGKSVWLLQMILTLLLAVPGNLLMMYLIDPKRVEFPSFSYFKNVKVYTEIEEAYQLLQSLIELMEKRYQILGENGIRNIAQYNRKFNETPMPYVVSIIDEFSDFILQDEEGKIEEMIIRLAQKARACGIHLIITTQRPSVDVVTGLIKANLPSRVVFRCSGRNDYSTVLDQKPPYNLLGQGDGVCLMEGEPLKRFQGVLIASDDEKMDQIIKDYGINQSVIAPLTLNITNKEEGDISGPLDELKRYIAFTGETRVTYLRKYLKMRMNDVKELMQELVKEGWLEAPKTRNEGYKLKLSEEERKSYLESDPNKNPLIE